jgi:hypothetical protein
MLAITSFAFMLQEVPAPPDHISYKLIQIPACNQLITSINNGIRNSGEITHNRDWQLQQLFSQNQTL